MGAEVVPLKREDFYTDAVGVDSDCVRLRVVDRGPRDGVPVLMLHGWPDSAWLWRNQADPMTKAGFRLLIPDQRGFGGSDRPIEVEAYTPSNLIADALAVLDHAGLKRAHVVGHDWGAAIAWSMAAHLPERVISLTALWVGHPAAFLGAGMRQQARSWYMLLFLFEGAAERHLSDNNWARFRRLVGGHPETDLWISDLSRPGALTASLNWYRGIHSIEAYLRDEARTPPLKTDVLRVWSDRDFALTEEQMMGSSAFVTGHWRYEHIDGAGHWIPLDAPERLGDLLVVWIAARSD